MGATNAKMDFEAFGVRDIELPRLRPTGRHVNAVLRFDGVMQIGVVYPQTELRGDPAAVRQIGKATEDLGFRHLVAYDHVLGAVHADRARRLTGP